MVIFGGLGSLPGTVYAAYAIGLIQADGRGRRERDLVAAHPVRR